ncbi:MAG: hypothetical protein ACXIUD_10320 [Mongoliitalea sp.]
MRKLLFSSILAISFGLGLSTASGQESVPDPETGSGGVCCQDEDVSCFHPVYFIKFADSYFKLGAITCS